MVSFKQCDDLWTCKWVLGHWQKCHWTATDYVSDSNWQTIIITKQMLARIKSSSCLNGSLLINCINSSSWLILKNSLFDIVICRQWDIQCTRYADASRKQANGFLNNAAAHCRCFIVCRANHLRQQFPFRNENPFSRRALHNRPTASARSSVRHARVIGLVTSTLKCVSHSRFVAEHWAVVIGRKVA